MVGATESAPRESGSPRRAGLRCMLMSVERSCVPVVDSRDDPVTESFMESSKNDPNTGMISLLKYLNGLAKRNLEKAKSQLLQAIWEVKKDIWELEQLRDAMSYLVPRALKCIAERSGPTQSKSS
jgi:hypothetical protein